MTVPFAGGGDHRRTEEGGIERGGVVLTDYKRSANSEARSQRPMPVRFLRDPAEFTPAEYPCIHAWKAADARGLEIVTSAASAQGAR